LQLNSQIAEVEDMLSYCNNVFNIGETAMAAAAAAWAALAALCPTAKALRASVSELG